MRKVGSTVSVTWRKSLALWILGFLTFVAALNVVEAAFIWSMYGIESMVHVYVLGDLILAWRFVSVTTYFWVSLVATFVLLGMVTLQVLRRPPLGPEVHRMVLKVEDEMVATRGALESTRISLFARIEDEKIARQDMIISLNASIDNVRKEMLDKLENNRTVVAEERKELIDAIKELGNFREDVLRTMAQQNKNALATEEDHNQDS